MDKEKKYCFKLLNSIVNDANTDKISNYLLKYIEHTKNENISNYYNEINKQTGGSDISKVEQNTKILRNILLGIYLANQGKNLIEKIYEKYIKDTNNTNLTFEEFISKIIDKIYNDENMNKELVQKILAKKF
jgi:hypothetical protein